jgi:hypothetical protein
MAYSRMWPALAWRKEISVGVGLGPAAIEEV